MADTADELATLRRRQADIAARANALAQSQGGTLAGLFQVFNAGAMPSGGLKYYATNPVWIGGSETEGSTPTINAGSAQVNVAVLGGTPSVGDVLIARRTAGRWVAERGVTSPIVTTHLVQIFIQTCYSILPDCTVTLSGPGGTFSCHTSAATETTFGWGANNLCVIFSVPEGDYTIAVTGLSGPYAPLLITSTGIPGGQTGPDVTVVLGTVIHIFGPNLPAGLHCCEVNGEMTFAPDTLNVTIGACLPGLPLVTGPAAAVFTGARSCTWNVAVSGGSPDFPVIGYLGGDVWSLAFSDPRGPVPGVNSGHSGCYCLASGSPGATISLSFPSGQVDWYVPNPPFGISVGQTNPCGNVPCDNFQGYFFPAEVSS